MIAGRNNITLPMAFGLYFASFVSRALAVRFLTAASKVGTDLLTTSPLQSGLLTTSAMCAALLSLDPQSRAAQIAAAITFRLFPSLFFSGAKPAGKGGSWWWGRRWSDESQGPNLRSSPSFTFSPGPPSAAGSEGSTWSGNTITSFRIPDKKLAANRRNGGRGGVATSAAAAAARGGNYASGGYAGPRGTPSTPPRSRGRSSTPPTSPFSSERVSGGGPAVSPRSSNTALTFTLGIGPKVVRTDARAFDGANGPTGRRPLVIQRQSRSAQSSGVSRPTTNMRGGYSGYSSGAEEDSAVSSGPTASMGLSSMPHTPTAASEQVPQLLSAPTTPTLSSAASSLSSFIRPLIPNAPSFDAFQWGGKNPFARAQSCPAPCSPSGSQRCSLDGAGGSSARHYTHGDVTAHPARKVALHRQAMAARRGNASSGGAGTQNFGSAVASVGLDGDCPASIREIVTDEHLVQLGALLEEPASQAALRALRLPQACAEAGTLFGAADAFGDGEEREWEQVAGDARPGLQLQAWRSPLRRGLFAYKTIVLIEGVSPSDVRPFHLDDQARALWDDGALAVSRPVPAGLSRSSRHAESCLHLYVSKFPCPMAPRRYHYARRVWHRPTDGGCYAICQSVEPEEGVELAGPRAVPVLEFTSSTVIRSAHGGTEVATVYYEDSQVRPALAKMGVPKGLWPFWSKYETALRVFVEARNASPRCVGGGMTAPGSRGGPFGLGGDASSDDGSDDELYGALSQLKAARQKQQKGGGWPKRLMIAGAVKLMHGMLSAR